MTIQEIREKETDQLHTDLLERRRHLFDLRSQAVTEKLEDPSLLRKTRKDIARILTTLHQREQEKNNQASASSGKATTSSGKASATSGQASAK